MICACIPTYKAVLTHLFPNSKFARSHHHHHPSPVPTPTFPPEDLKYIAQLNISFRTNTFDLDTGGGKGSAGGSVFGTSKTSLCIHNGQQDAQTMRMSEEVLEMVKIVKKRESRPLSITQEFIREIGLVVDDRRLVVEEEEEVEGGRWDRKI
ncbi:hypothetical protein L873DRAFT_1820957 [Choiromyces venosus 120613-1]|uniref:Uncharacterized protein n=1 Tax=Choiromyces venosus 120613-1 TaxID=1336337 RepID=A0A3N4J1T7_9PEZI|nr:hypothetical protein L873DRAFT_1820957 [Choiromyces venosus 120613-1]